MNEFEAVRRVIGPNWAVTAAWDGAADVAEYAGDRDRAEAYLRQGLEKARRGDIGLHVGMFGLRLVPYLLDRGDHDGASGLLRESESALNSVNRLDAFYRPMLALRRCQVALAMGHTVEAAAQLADLLPHDADDPPLFALLIEQLEAAGLLLASIQDPRADSIFGAVDRWTERSDAVPNPVVMGRRRVPLGRSGLIGGDDAPELSETVGLARRALREVESRV